MERHHKGMRVLAQNLALAAALAASAGVSAQQQEKQNNQQFGQRETKAQTGQQLTAESFIKHAAMGGQLEVQVGQLAQQKAQNQQVQQLGQALVQDHREANQRLMQIARQKNIDLSQQLDQKHQQKLNKLQQASGAEFDKQFVKQTVQHHKKDIQKFETASRQFSNEPELRSFAEQTLPKLREHLQMAQAAAGAVGLDAASLAADAELDEQEAAGAPGAAIIGESQLNQQQQQQDAERRQFDVESGGEAQDPKPRSSIESDRDAGAQVDADAGLDADAGENSFSAAADVDADVDTENEGGVFEKGDGRILGLEFEKGDGEILGLPTSNNDGTILGLFPAPSRDIRAGSEKAYTAEELANGDVDEGIDSVAEADTDAVAVGGPAGSASASAATTIPGVGQGSSAENIDFNDAPDRVQEILKSKGWNEQEGQQLQKVTLYRAMINGQPVVVNQQGQIVSPSQGQGQQR